jgi:hypothetical protein
MAYQTVIFDRYEQGRTLGGGLGGCETPLSVRMSPKVGPKILLNTVRILGPKN